MLRRYLTLKTLQKRWSSTKPMVQMDDVVNEQLESEKLHPRRHPGILKLPTIEIPKWVEKGIIKATTEQSLKTLRQNCEHLATYLNQRHPPPEEIDVRTQLAAVKQLILNKVNFTKPMTKEEMEEFWKKNSFNVQNALKQRIYSWTAIEYDAHKSLLYLLARGAQDYAVLYQIFYEISVFDKHFNPKTLFDFGSGVGTTVWAASEFWKRSLGEYYCVDSSADMHNVAEIVIGKEQSSIKGVYYRQFLPASAKKTSDIVVSAFSLFEMPNAKARLNLILNLWLKTERYLVIVEQGTNAGFKIVNEARDFILNMASQSLETKNPTPCHVFAPCPHDLICPRYIVDNTPCNFQVRYFTLSLGRTPEVKKEKYCYVVLRKGDRAAENQEWPRIVRSTMVRSKHTICRMCTAAGKLEEVIFTAAKHGKFTYRCARYSNWGDKLPLRLIDRPKTDDPE